jgi:hypothetical protein
MPESRNPDTAVSLSAAERHSLQYAANRFNFIASANEGFIRNSLILH